MSTEMPELLSTRQAAERLAALGMDREAARRALNAGIAGPGQRTSSAILYREDHVVAVVAYALRPLGGTIPAATAGCSLPDWGLGPRPRTTTGGSGGERT